MMFDAAVYLVMLVAVIAGFNAGFLRSMVTILAYLVAMPVAAAATSLISPALAGQFDAARARDSMLFVVIFLVTGIVLGYLLRLALSETVGIRISIPDRVAGSALGAVRVVLVAVLMVLIFDQLIPADREPGFLRGSQLKPVLSMAARQGLKSLPPETTAFIDQLRKNQRL